MVTCNACELNEREREGDGAGKKMLGRPNVRRERRIGKEMREGKVVLGPGLFEMAIRLSSFTCFHLLIHNASYKSFDIQFIKI